MFSVLFPEFVNADTTDGEIYAVFKELRGPGQISIRLSRGQAAQVVDFGSFKDRRPTQIVAFLQRRDRQGAREEISPRIRLSSLDVISRTTGETLIKALDSDNQELVDLAAALNLSSWVHSIKSDFALEQLAKEVNQKLLEEDLQEKKVRSGHVPILSILRASYSLATDLLLYLLGIFQGRKVLEDWMETYRTEVDRLPLVEALTENQTNEFLSPLESRKFETALALWGKGQAERNQSLRIESGRPKQVFSSLTDFLKGSGQLDSLFRVEHCGLPIDCGVRIFEGAPLVVMLHGRRAPSVKLPYLSGAGVTAELPISRLSISDPTLYLDEDCLLSWYAGNYLQPTLQDDLVSLILRVAEVSKAPRIGFVGGSGGGFASIALSGKIPQSRAFVWNPQTDIRRYSKRFYDSYANTAWPRLTGDVDNQIVASVVEQYLGTAGDEKLANEVLYLQQSADRHHIVEHFIPFLDALQGDPRIEMHIKRWGDGHFPPQREVLVAGIKWATGLVDVW